MGEEELLALAEHTWRPGRHKDVRSKKEHAGQPSAWQARNKAAQVEMLGESRCQWRGHAASAMRVEVAGMIGCELGSPARC